MNSFLGEKFKQYWGIITYIIILSYAIFNFNDIINGGKNILSILSPFIVGIAIAFVLNLVMRIFEKKIFAFLDSKKYKKYIGVKRPLSVLLTFITVFTIIIGLIIFIIPQLIDSISTLTDAIPGYIKSFENLLDKYVSNKEILSLLWDNFLLGSHPITSIFAQILTSSF